MLDVRYVGKVYRPPSEAHSFILQATIGCSWNKCAYCDMYRDKPEFQLRPMAEILEDLDMAAREFGSRVEKVFVADGDALIMDMARWEEILDAVSSRFENLRRVSCYAMASNILDKSVDELGQLRAKGLSLLYIGPESGDDVTLKRIVKGATFDDHTRAASRTRQAGIEVSAIFLLGAGGTERSEVHAMRSAELATAMDPEYVSALTLTVVPGTPMAKLQATGRFELPDIYGLLRELRTFVAHAEPKSALFRTNHASNYLPLAGRLPDDRDGILATIDAALRGDIALRPEGNRGL